MALAPKKLIFHSSSSSSSSSSSASEGSQKINTMDEDGAISETPASIALDRISTQQVHNQADKQKHSEKALEKTQEQEDDSTCVPNSKAQEMALLDENQTTEAGEKGNEPALDKISTLQMHNQVDKQKQSQAVLEKTQEQGDCTCDPNSKIQEALLDENQTTKSGEKEGDEPALDKLTALQTHNQADQQKLSHIVLGKTQEQGDSTCDLNSKIQEALSGKNQTSEAGEKEGDEPALKKIGEQEDSNSNSVGCKYLL